MIEQRIKSLIEHRTIEAVRKDISKKLHTVLRTFGRPVMEQEVPFGPMSEFWDGDGIPEFDGDVIMRGYYFDALRWGINLTIKAEAYDGTFASIEANYDGRPVFSETDGDLTGYAPFPAWEDALERLYKQAVPVDKVRSEQALAGQREKDQRQVTGIIEKLKRLWGFET